MQAFCGKRVSLTSDADVCAWVSMGRRDECSPTAVLLVSLTHALGQMRLSCQTRRPLCCAAVGLPSGHSLHEIRTRKPVQRRERSIVINDWRRAQHLRETPLASDVSPPFPARLSAKL